MERTLSGLENDYSAFATSASDRFSILYGFHTQEVLGANHGVTETEYRQEWNRTGEFASTAVDITRTIKDVEEYLYSEEARFDEALDQMDDLSEMSLGEIRESQFVDEISSEVSEVEHVRFDNMVNSFNDIMDKVIQEEEEVADWHETKYGERPTTTRRLLGQ